MNKQSGIDLYKFKLMQKKNISILSYRAIKKSTYDYLYLQL